MKNLILILITFFSLNAFSWGGRGHAAICETAVFLVKDKSFKDYLQNKPHMMAHLCNIPDIAWRDLPQEFTKHGNPTHYVNSEILGLPPQHIPTDLKLLISKYSGQANNINPDKKINDLALDMGTNWWRADQFLRLAIESAEQFKKAAPPENSKQEQDIALPYNKYFYEMIVYLGIMGHFVGDNSQPFHVTSDYDGYAAGHGGIHAYYEDSAVAHFGPDLHDKIYKTAQKIISNKKAQPKFLTQKNTVEKMQALAELSANELKSVLKVDPVIANSTLKIEKGLSLRTPAVRQPSEVGFKKFEKLMLTQMARSSLLLADLWDEAYTKAGKPDIKAYKSYQYPLKPDFILPDYYEIKK